ncbi:MAG: sodium:calcium antiporter [Candidatus Caldarchaeum sp.]|nr:sodium:calcium antiporter [Candidatus Caldarchaeum sp.]
MAEILEAAGLFALAGLGVSFFGYLVVRGAEELADKYGLDRFMIGFILLSVLTSTPEWTVAAVSALQGVVEISVGDIFGSNVVNISLVTAFSMIFARKALTITDSFSKSLVEVLYLSTLIPIMLLYFPAVSSWTGVLLMAFFALYVYIAYGNKRPPTVVSHVVKTSTFRILIQIMLSAGLLVFSATQLVAAARAIAEITGISQLEVGAKLVAVSTSAPELVTVAASMRRGEHAMALGNAVGSNLTNVTLILGSLLALSGANIVLTSHVYTVLFVILVSMTFWFFSERGKITIPNAVILLALYVAFLAFGR